MVKLSKARNIKVGSEEFTVGYSEQLSKYILCITVTNWFLDYDRWYSITDDEFNNEKQLIRLYKQLKNDCKSERYIFSWKKSENTSEQGELLHSIVGDDPE